MSSHADGSYTGPTPDCETRPLACATEVLYERANEDEPFCVCAFVGSFWSDEWSKPSNWEQAARGEQAVLGEEHAALQQAFATNAQQAIGGQRRLEPACLAACVSVCRRTTRTIEGVAFPSEGLFTRPMKIGMGGRFEGSGQLSTAAGAGSKHYSMEAKSKKNKLFSRRLSRASL